MGAPQHNHSELQFCPVKSLSIVAIVYVEFCHAVNVIQANTRVGAIHAKTLVRESFVGLEHRREAAPIPQGCPR